MKPISRSFLMVCCLLGLAACGFQPLYAGKKEKSPVMREYYDAYGVTGEDSVMTFLAQIYIEPIEDRLGQILRQHLEKRLSPKGGAKHQPYHLRVVTTSSTRQQGVRSDDTATREIITFNANYQLIVNGSTLVEGRTSTIGSYNLLKAIYGTVASKQDTEERAMKILADDIALRLSVYFRSQKKK